MSKTIKFSQQHGMTLLELLVAVALMSVIAVMAFASIYTLTESKRHLDETVDRLNQESAALGLFNQDIKMAIGEQSSVSANRGSSLVGDTQNLRLQRFNPYQSVPRQGIVNHLKQRPATVLDVRWFVRGDIWYRATRSAAATAYAPWQQQPMMDIQQIRCQYQSVNGQLIDRWPPRQGPATALPKAVHCHIRSQHNRQSDMVITPWQQIW